ncbi:MAG: hypothetical protein ACI32C_01480 [Candidatus Enteromonas sp.]
MNPRRGDAAKSSSLSLAKTLATSLIIAALISAAALVFALTSFYKGYEGDLLPIYLGWGLSYGVFALAGIVFAAVFLILMPTRPKMIQGISISGIVYGSLVALCGLPMGIVLQKWEFFVSLAIIGGCILAIGILTLKSYKEEFRTK